MESEDKKRETVNNLDFDGVKEESEYNKYNKNMGNLIFDIRSYIERFVDGPEDMVELQRILNAIEKVDRKHYVGNNPYSYIDSALPIGDSQTISQPSTVARMIQLAEIRSGEDILEVGSGSGWNASIMAFLAYPGTVLSIDRVESLVKKAWNNSKEAMEKEGISFENLNFKKKNLFDLIEEKNLTVDTIMITAGIMPGQETILEKMAVNLLKDQGKIICPYQNGPILIITKDRHNIKTEYTDEQYSFVPLLE
ncbi:MAG: protein-L-isoaspartate O-methyltransferase family protein [Candidatus Woesearchaeota archaeon]